MLGAADETAQEAMFSQVVWAMSASLSSKTSKAERDASEQLLSTLKHSKQEGLTVLARIISCDNSNLCGEPLKLLALSIYNDWIRTWWDQLSQSETAAVKQHICQEIVMHPLVLTNNHAVKTKAAVLLSNIAERLFPQQWSTMMAEFISIWMQSAYPRQEVIIKTFECITADCIDADFNSALPTLRRQEIVAALVEQQHELLQTSFDYLMFCMHRQQQLLVSQQQQQQRQQSDEAAAAAVGELKSLRDAVQSLLTMLTALADLVKPEELLAASHDFLSPLWLPELITSPSINYAINAPTSMIQVAHLLLCISRQKLSLEVFSRLVAALAVADVQQLPEEAEEALRFQRTYSQALHNIISQNLHFLVPPSTTATVAGVPASSGFYGTTNAAQLLQLYIEKLIALLRSPSRKLSQDVLKDWVKIYRDEAVRNLPLFEQVAMVVLSEYMQKCRKPLWCEVPGLAADESFELEFEDHDEWNEFYGVFKSHLKLLAQAMTTTFPALVAQSLSSYLIQLVSSNAGTAAVLSSSSSGSSGGSTAAVLACKTLQLELDTFHIAYGTLLKEGVVTTDEAVAANTITNANAAVVAATAAVLNATAEAYVKVLQWHPVDLPLLLEQLKLLQYHSPLLRRSPQLLAQTFSYLFETLGSSSSSGSSGSSSSGSSMVVMGIKVSSCISSLTSTCAKEIVQSQFFPQFLEQVGSILSAVNYQKGVKTSMRQVLLALSEHMSDENSRIKSLSLAVEDVIVRWDAAAALFQSPQTLFSALVQKRAGNSSAFAEMKELLDIMLLTSKRVAYPQLPNELWAFPATVTTAVAATVGATAVVSAPGQSPIRIVSYAQYCACFPFAPAWQQFLPAVFRAVETAHSFWSVDMRRTIALQQQQQQQQQQQGVVSSAEDTCIAEVAAALYAPLKGDVIRAAGTKGAAHQAAAAAADSSAVGKIAIYDVKEFLIFLYQALGQAAAHKSLYFQSEQQLLRPFLANLAQHLPFMENAHMMLLLRNFAESFVLNALPMFYADVAQFLSELMNAMLFRLSIAWDRSSSNSNISSSGDSFNSSSGSGCSSWQQPPQSEQQFFCFVYRECSIPSTTTTAAATAAGAAAFGGLSPEDVENARDHIISDMTKAFVDAIASYMGLRGFLFTPTGNQLSSPAVTAAAVNGGSLSSVASFLNDDESLQLSHQETEQVQQEMVKQLRRDALQQLLMGRDFPHLTKAFVSSVVALICLPDIAACRVSLQIAQKILDHCASDQRFVVPIAQDAFSAAVMVLLRQEKWSVGLEWDVIEFLVDVYVMLVLGEGRQPVNAQDAAGNVVSSSALMPNRGLTDLPRQILLSLHGVQVEHVQALESNFMTMMMRKKRRGIMKDFISEVFRRSQPQNNNGGNSSAPTGSIMQSNATGSVAATNAAGGMLDVRNRLFRSTRARYGRQQSGDAMQSAQDFDLAKLFDS